MDTLTTDYVWPVKSDLKNAVIAYKAHINGGITEKKFSKMVSRDLYDHFKKSHDLLSTEEVDITTDDLSNLSMTPGEFTICLDTLGNMLTNEVKIDHRNFNEVGSDIRFKIMLTLLKK